MKQRNKIIFTLFLTITVMLSGGLLYFEMVKAQHNFISETSLSINPIVSTPAPPAQMKSSSPRGLANFDTRNEFSYSKDSVLDVTQPMQSGRNGRSLKRVTPQKTNPGYEVYRNSTLLQGRTGSSGGSSSSAFYASGRNSSSSESSYGGGFNTGNSIAPPALVPFEDNSNVIMNMDPGMDPDHFIPVGDAPWLLALFSLLYAAVRISFRRK